jgi:hypothetical protein
MEYFYSEGGSNRPYFIYRFRVKNCTTEMYQWAEAYPEKGPFSRFHVEWSSVYTTGGMPRGYDVIQFEHNEAAKIFRIAFAGEYEDITMKEYRLD